MEHLDDAKMMAPPGEFLAYINPKEADMLKAAGGSGIMTPMGIPSFIEYDDDFGSGFQSAEDLHQVLDLIVETHMVKIFQGFSENFW